MTRTHKSTQTQFAFFGAYHALAVTFVMAVTILVVLLLIPAPAKAQNSGPIQLVPSTTTPPPATATEDEDEDDDEEKKKIVTRDDESSEDTGTEEDADEEDADEDDADDEDPVAVGALRPPDPSAVGLLSADNGGLGPALWRGADLALIEALIPNLPAKTNSRAMRALMQRLLLSAAPVPEGQSNAASFLGVRIDQLWAMGDVDAALGLVLIAPVGLFDPTFSRTHADGLFLRGDHSGACEIIEREIASGRSDEFWFKGLIFCRALRQEVEAARLGADLLLEMGETGDEAFFTLIAALIGEPGATLVSLPAPVPLHLAMLGAVRQEIPADAVITAGPAVLAAIAGAPNAEIGVRLIAAEKAEAIGALRKNRLSQLYASVEFSPDELANAVSIALAEDSPRTRALLYQAGQVQTVPAARAEAMRAAWGVSRRNGGFATAARINHDALMQIQAGEELAWFSGDAGLALLAVGENDAARVWFDLARANASVNAPEAAQAVLDLWPLTVIASQAAGSTWTTDAIHNWWMGQGESPLAIRNKRAGLFYTMFESFGLMVPPADWQPLLNGSATRSGQIPSPALWRNLREASISGRLGETIIYAMLALGHAGPASANPLTLESVIAALRAVGLDQDARALAVEAMLAETL